MKDLILFLENNWQLIVSCLFFILSFILQLFKKKPIEIVSSISELIYKLTPEKISWYEKFFGEGHGKEKRDSVIRSVMEEIERCYALTDNQRSVYKYYISNYIEEILSTPQKHEKDER